ncbi:MAG: DUF4179 domain-containing protein [Clostridia bacterium]|nr:DUF4179 domain-containing protein [Clostridia bacterium]
MKKLTALLAALMMILGILFNGALASDAFVAFEPYDGNDFFERPTFPDLSDELIPLNLSREDQGIRFEILAGVVKGNNACFECSVQDLEGDRVNKYAVTCAYISDNIMSSGKTSHYEWLSEDEANHKVTFRVIIKYRQAPEPEDGLCAIGFNRIETRHGLSNDLIPTLQEYGTTSEGIDPPEGIQEGWFDSNSVTEDLKILDYTQPLNIPLRGIEKTTVSAIGWIDGKLHVQTRTVQDPDPSRVVSLTGRRTGSYQYRRFNWTDADNTEWNEYILTDTPEDMESAGLNAEVDQIQNRVDGDWTISFPIDSVRVDSDGSEDGFMYDWTPEKRARRTFGEVADKMQPLNLTAEKQGCRMDLLYAYTEGKSLWLVYTLQDVEGNKKLDADKYPDVAVSVLPVKAQNSVISLDYSNRERKLICLEQLDYREPFPTENQSVSISFNLEPVVQEKIRIPFSFMLDDIRTTEAGDTAVTVPAITEGDPSAAAYAKIIDSKLEERYGNILDKLQPVNLSREDQGIRLDVHYIGVNGSSEYIVYSLLDLEADSRDGELDPSITFDYITCTTASGYTKSYADEIATICSNEYNGQTTYARVFRHGWDDSDSVPDENRLASINVKYAPISKSISIDVLSQVKECAAEADGVDSPELLPNSLFRENDYSWERIPDNKTKVLDYTRPLDLPLYQTISVTGAGWIDGKLHVQAHNQDAELFGGSDHHRTELSDWAYLSSRSSVSNDAHLYWDDNGDGYAEWYEYTFDAMPEDLEQAQRLTVHVREYTDIVHGDWTVELPGA